MSLGVEADQDGASLHHPSQLLSWQQPFHCLFIQEVIPLWTDSPLARQQSVCGGSPTPYHGDTENTH
jgi:hypothetical protein